MIKLILLVIIVIATGFEVCGGCNDSILALPQIEFDQIINATQLIKETQEAFLIKASPTSNSKVGIVFKNLDGTCRRYADVLAYKDQLQKQLFNNATRQTGTIALLTSLIIELQTAAMKLQQIEIKITAKYCITFTSEEYELIYLSRLHSTEDDLINSLNKRAKNKWVDYIDTCDKWENYD